MLLNRSVVTRLQTRPLPWLVNKSIALRCSSSKAKVHEPLRILFCGADEFSIESLKALQKLRETDDSIQTIQIACRKPKRYGRNLRLFRKVPIATWGNRNGLSVHEIDTFTGWQPPTYKGHPFNLIIAVSFGLLVPPRILGAAKYGGLNLHPSLLPELRGPAPIHWTLLHDLSHTGVTLQTLHPKHFDQGIIIDQTPRPGLAIVKEHNPTPSYMTEVLGKKAAEMLVDNIKNDTFVNPKPLPPSRLQAKAPTQATPDSTSVPAVDLSYAPKITPEDRKIDWVNWTTDQLLIRDRVLGNLWDMSTHSLVPIKHTKQEAMRYIYTDFTRVDTSRLMRVIERPRYCWQTSSKKEPPAIKRLRENVLKAEGESANDRILFVSPVSRTPNQEWKLVFRLKDGGLVSPRRVLIEGKGLEDCHKLIEGVMRRFKTLAAEARTGTGVAGTTLYEADSLDQEKLDKLVLGAIR